ncbi:MAG: hypothetical protein LBT20_06995 [Clostridiales bacterium]|jgi:hypothetical protein|nr:hypothetical protein [Clostridiales bacterium]
MQNQVVKARFGTGLGPLSGQKCAVTLPPQSSYRYQYPAAYPVRPYASPYFPFGYPVQGNYQLNSGYHYQPNETVILPHAQYYLSQGSVYDPRLPMVTESAPAFPSYPVSSDEFRRAGNRPLRKSVPAPYSANSQYGQSQYAAQPQYSQSPYGAAPQYGNQSPYAQSPYAAQSQYAQPQYAQSPYGNQPQYAQPQQYAQPYAAGQSQYDNSSRPMTAREKKAVIAIQKAEAERAAGKGGKVGKILLAVFTVLFFAAVAALLYLADILPFGYAVAGAGLFIVLLSYTDRSKPLRLLAWVLAAALCAIAFTAARQDPNLPVLDSLKAVWETIAEFFREIF